MKTHFRRAGNAPLETQQTGKMMTGHFGFREPEAKRVTEDVLCVHLEQIEDLDTELIVKIAVA